MDFLSKNSFRSIFLYFFIVFQSCSSLKPGSTNSGSSLYTSFFVGEKGTQYFIKPIKFKSNDSDNEMMLDITFRYKDSLHTDATLNYSVINQEIIKNIDSIVIANPTNKISCKHNKRLYNERKKNNYFSRFSTNTPSAKLKKVFANSNWTITTYYNNKKRSYLPTKKSKKSITTLNEYLFVIF